MTQLTLQVNGRTTRSPLMTRICRSLYALRDDLALRSPKFGCGLGQCGACTVLIDGEATRSCIIRPSMQKDGKSRRWKGSAAPSSPSRVQAAFIAEQAAQCGYCTNGMIMTATALLGAQPHPTRPTCARH